jgi:hypothetical protein
MVLPVYGPLVSYVPDGDNSNGNPPKFRKPTVPVPKHRLCLCLCPCVGSMFPLYCPGRARMPGIVLCLALLAPAGLALSPLPSLMLFHSVLRYRRRPLSLK